MWAGDFPRDPAAKKSLITPGKAPVNVSHSLARALVMRWLVVGGVLLQGLLSVQSFSDFAIVRHKVLFASHN